MLDTLLVINAGSSSLKFHVYALKEAEPQFHCGGQFSGIGTERAQLRIKAADGTILVDQRFTQAELPDPATAQTRLGDWLENYLDQPPVAVGHRIVHGGPDFTESVLIDAQVEAKLAALIPLAPLHQPVNLALIARVARRWPGVPQVASFDTAFHQLHGSVAGRYALPRRLFEAGVRRYGFHGLSYQYIADRLREQHPALAAGRVIVAHLGSGASASALVNGRCVDTTMGFTPLDGLPMATRPGSLDPGVVLWMMESGMSHADIQQLLYHESGMKGLSGITGDMRALLASDAPAAKLAVAYFTFRTAQQLAGLCVAAGGIDALIFTAGIGEHSAPIRAGICGHLRWLGIELDPALNQQGAASIAAAGSRVAVLIEPTDEELVIARQTVAWLARGRPESRREEP